MKQFLKIVFLTALFIPFIISCSKEDNPEPPQEIKTTYNFKYSADDYKSQGLIIDVTVFEYNSANEKVAQQHVKNCTKGHSSNHTAHKLAEKVKVYVEATHEKTNKSTSFWIQQVFYLQKGSNTIVDVTGSIRVGNTEP